MYGKLPLIESGSGQSRHKQKVQSNLFVCDFLVVLEKEVTFLLHTYT